MEIFRAYDIRGVYPKDIDEEVAFKIGQSFVYFLRKTTKKENLNIAIGRDNRISSPVLHKAIIEGIINSGANAIDIGFSTSPMLYFSVAHYGFDGGVEISASHNPKDYNGFKLVREKAVPISEETGLREIKEILLKNEFSKNKKGKFFKKEVLEDYVNFILKDLSVKEMKSFRVIIDTANAVSGIIIPEISKKISCKIYHLFPELDGNFPNHSPDPLIKENLKELQEEMKNKKADLGVAFDGDGDRIIFMDEKGMVIPADLVFAMILDLILRDKKGEKVLYDLRSSNIVKETIENADGVPIMGRVGHSFIKERMRKENILLAGELSGHYYFKENYFFESPFFILFKVIEVMSESKKHFSELIRTYQKYFHSGEINFKVEDKDKKIKELENYFRAGEVSHLDGIRIDFQDWWFNVRPSNTEPLLRLVVEAKTEELMKKKKEEIEKLISN